MKYLALADGTIGRGTGVRRVRAGEVFTLPAGFKPGKWMKAVEEPKAEAAEAKPKEPKAKQPIPATAPAGFDPKL